MSIFTKFGIRCSNLVSDLLNSWSWFSTSGDDPTSWADMETGGPSEKTWNDLES